MPARSKSASAKDSTANLGFEAGFGQEHADTFRGNYVIATPLFSDFDTAPRDGAFFQSEAKPQVVSAANYNFRKDDVVLWQWSRARSAAKGSPQGERGGDHQFGVAPKGNANFAWVQHFIHHPALRGIEANFGPKHADTIRTDIHPTTSKPINALLMIEHGSPF